MGDTISFWNDRWHDCGIPFVIFSRLFRLSCTPDIFVAEAWLADSKTWDLHLDVILLIMKFRNGYFCLLFCLIADFIWCLILGDGLLTPHLCLL